MSPLIIPILIDILIGMEPGRFPNSLKKHRRIAGLTQVQVAAILELGNSTNISLWEKGKYLPNVKQLFQLCVIYNTSPEHLFGTLFQEVRQELFAQHEPIINKEIFNDTISY